ncbi:MAG: GTPase HflX [Anaerolineales bacterium]|jgi:GTP-binding protein HflX
MSKPLDTVPTTKPRDRAFLIGVERLDQPNLLPVDDSLDELALLADTAGLKIVGQAVQKLRTPNPKTFLGSGKVEEVNNLVEETKADIVLFDDELSPRHQRELEEIFGDEVQVIDRTALILDIFAQHAQTHEGSLQVELAQYEYRLPRLTRAWTHLARQAGGGGGRAGSTGGVGLRGPGETQLEVDRREISRRIATLKDQLEKVRAHRSRYRARRRKSAIPTVALVGYTNAGKSTLLNQLSQAEVYVANQLFATLDPTTRNVELPEGREVLFTDTVGFIQKLPTMLVAAFRATLEEITEADLIIHVLDVTHPNVLEQAQAVSDTLELIETIDIPIITALNKIDRLENLDGIKPLEENFDPAIPISALTGRGIPDLLAVVESDLYDALADIQVELPYREGRLISLFYEHAIVEDALHGKESVSLRGKIQARHIPLFGEYVFGDHSSEDDIEHPEDEPGAE